MMKVREAINLPFVEDGSKFWVTDNTHIRVIKPEDMEREICGIDYNMIKKILIMELVPLVEEVRTNA